MVRIIGDVHGKYNQYVAIANQAEASVQVGDMGFRYDLIESLDPVKHVFFGGNHDNYDQYYAAKNALSNFGTDKVGDLDFFYVRGAFSIDKQARILHEQRTGYKSYWDKEEMSDAQLADCIELYRQLKPVVMLSHDGPTQATKVISNPEVLRAFGFNPDTFKTRTQQALTLMLKYHKPKLWIFGHYHKSVKFSVEGTQFACLPELGFVDVDGQGNMQ
jgi:predicted phosphodiesterase